MPTNNWFVWFRYLSATTYYKDCRRPTWLITTQWQITKVITGKNFATLFIIKYKFDKFNSKNNKRAKYATDEIQQTLLVVYKSSLKIPAKWRSSLRSILKVKRQGQLQMKLNLVFDLRIWPWTWPLFREYFEAQLIYYYNCYKS